MSAIPRSIPSSLDAGESATGETLEDVVETVEEIFSPRPDGIVARHRAERARREAAAQEAANVAEPIEQHSYKAVKVAEMTPENFSVNIVTIPPLGTAQVLPLSPYRYRALLTITPPAVNNPYEGYPTITTPVIPASTVLVQNIALQPYYVQIIGGAVSVVTVNGQQVGAGDGTYLVPSGGTIAMTYTAAPSWVWVAGSAFASGALSASYVLLAKDNGQALGGIGFPLQVNVPIETRSRAQLYAYNPGASAVTVAILVELNAPETTT